MCQLSGLPMQQLVVLSRFCGPAFSDGGLYLDFGVLQHRLKLIEIRETQDDKKKHPPLNVCT